MRSPGLVDTTEELKQPSVVLRRPRARSRDLNDEGEEFFVGRHKSTLYSLEESTTRSRRESFNLVQGLSSIVIATLRAFSKEFLKKICNAILSLELYSMAAKN